MNCCFFKDREVEAPLLSAARLQCDRYCLGTSLEAESKVSYRQQILSFRLARSARPSPYLPTRKRLNLKELGHVLPKFSGCSAWQQKDP
jgi:hypothetical protein